MADLIELLRESTQTVVFSGAGVSTLSGIPDFRGEHGLARQFDIEKVFSIDSFLADPSFFYTHARDFLYSLGERRPNLVHEQCARLEQLGLVTGVITQNIDMLHQRAGSTRVWELHGSPEYHHCLGCGASYSFEHISGIVRQGDVPDCSSCGGIVKPDVVFYGEMLPETALSQALAAAAAADLMLVLGSTLLVQPAASLPLHTVRGGGKLVVVNKGATPLDELAVCRLDDLEESFQRIATEI